MPRAALATTAAAVGLAVAVLDVAQLASLASAFVLLLFVALQASVLVMRRRPRHEPSFRVPLVPVLPLAGVAACSALFVQLGSGAALFCAVVVGGSAGWHAARRAAAGTLVSGR